MNTTYYIEQFRNINSSPLDFDFYKWVSATNDISFKDLLALYYQQWGNESVTVCYFRIKLKTTSCQQT